MGDTDWGSPQDLYALQHLLREVASPLSMRQAATFAQRPRHEQGTIESMLAHAGHRLPHMIEQARGAASCVSKGLHPAFPFSVDALVDEAQTTFNAIVALQLPEGRMA